MIVLLDTIVANDLLEKLYDEKSNKIALDNFNMLDYLCVSMITYIREDSKNPYYHSSKERPSRVLTKTV